jgi:hypothetical protein
MHMGQRILSIIAMTTCLFACGHSGGATRSPNAEQPAAASSRDVVAGAHNADTAYHMEMSFWTAVDARDAIVRGDLASARRAGETLSKQDFAATLPEDWRAFVGAMQKEAGALAIAPDLPAAAQSVAAMATSCGNCHWFSKHGPGEPPVVPVPEPTADESVADRMQRHRVAVDDMWTGLIEPSDEAWRRGTITLTRAPIEAPAKEDGQALDTTIADSHAMHVAHPTTTNAHAFTVSSSHAAATATSLDGLASSAGLCGIQ